jgi:hypothetical protein
VGGVPFVFLSLEMGIFNWLHEVFLYGGEPFQPWNYLGYWLVERNTHTFFSGLNTCWCNVSMIGYCVKNQISI